MSIKNLLGQVLGSKNPVDKMMQSFSSQSPANNQSASNSHTGTINGMLGGLAAGGIVSLLVANKSARKFAGKAATFGGAALLGGAAYKMYKNWQHNSQFEQSRELDNPQNNQQSTPQEYSNANTFDYQLTVIKAMIAAAKADGHIDMAEQQRIFSAVSKMDISAEQKGMIFDLLSVPISIVEIANSVATIEQKSELYMASCLVIDEQNPLEREHLDKLRQALNMPLALTQEIEQQTNQLLLEADR